MKHQCWALIYGEWIPVGEKYADLGIARGIRDMLRGLGVDAEVRAKR